MKKIIALALCLTLTTPCFAAGRFKHQPPRPKHHTTYYVKCNCHNNIHRHDCCYRTSNRTRNLAVLTGISGVATVISAIFD